MSRLALALLLAACGPDPLRYESAPAEAQQVIEPTPEGPRVCSEAVRVLPVIEDTFLFEQYPAAANGSREDVVFSGAIGTRCYPLVRVDALEIPSGQLVSAALQFTTVNSGKVLTSSLLGGQARWDEGSTWRDMESDTSPWAEHIDATQAVTVSGRSELVLPVAWLAAWRDGVRVNNGVMLRTSDANGFNSFLSSESADPPAVVVRFVECL